MLIIRTLINILIKLMLSALDWLFSYLNKISILISIRLDKSYPFFRTFSA